MERKDVYNAVDTERMYQNIESDNPQRKDMVPDFDMAKAILAIERSMIHAREKWYKDNPDADYKTVMPWLRKIAGICVAMGEKYGMPEREMPAKPKKIVEEKK